MSFLPLFCLSGFFINLASTSSSVCKVVKYPSSIFQKGKRLQGFQFRASISVPDAFRCARMCFFRRRCLSFNYNQNMTLCEFNNARVDPPYVILNASRGYLYSDIDDWHEVIGMGSCQNRPCGICEACHPSEINYTCVNEELTSCRDIKICTNASSDGQYMVRPVMGTKPSLRVYCHKMNSTYPLDYITLIKDNFSKYPPYYQTCWTVNWYMNRPGVIFYYKIRLELVVIITDQTFTNISCDPRLMGISYRMSFERSGTNCSVSLNYGETGDCLATPCPQRRGMLQIDLQGTGLIVSPSVKWIVHGYKAKFSSFHRSSTNEEIKIVCGGTCGLCNPKGDLILEPKP